MTSICWTNRYQWLLILYLAAVIIIGKQLLSLSHVNFQLVIKSAWKKDSLSHQEAINMESMRIHINSSKQHNNSSKQHADALNASLDMQLALWGISLDGKAPSYISNYKNPCWYTESSPNSQTKTLHCLPYFYQLGVSKSGTTTLHENLAKHPYIHPAETKELFFWHDPALRSMGHNFKSYCNRFKDATNAIESQQNGSAYHEGITFEATPGYFTNQGDLNLIPNNWDRLTGEPKYTLAHTLYALNPHTRLLVALRNPVDRLFSHYHQFHIKDFSAKDFNEHVKAAIKMMNSCLSRRTLRSCAFDHRVIRKIRQDDKIMLHDSLYYPYVVEWLNVFPRNQMMFVLAEDWYYNSTRVMTEIFDFLALRHPGKDAYDNIERSMKRFRDLPANNFTNAITQSFHKLMWPETRNMLEEFYNPFNIKLAEFFGDKRFLFETR